MKGIFITGTDTDVGKTMVSAWLVRSWHTHYWKPVQTGGERDSDVIRALAPGATIHPSEYEFQAPLSPHEAARREGKRIELENFVLPASMAPILVEGAGGVLVPLNDKALMIDLMAHLGLPILVVARTTLGTINHTLLALEALARRGLDVAGIITNGTPDAANRAAIEHHSGIKVVAELPTLPSPAALAAHPPVTWRPPEFDP